jgi:hypothetical protein
MPALSVWAGSHGLDWLTSNFRGFRTAFCKPDELFEALLEALQGFP